MTSAIKRLATTATAAALVGALAVPAGAVSSDTTSGEPACKPSFRMIQGPTAQGHLAEAINRSGMVAGRWAGGGPMKIWQPDGTSGYVDLEWVEPRVYDLNDEGQILGTGYGPITNTRVSWVWQDGTSNRVPGTGVRLQGLPKEMNNKGVLVGHVRTVDGTRAAVWPSPTSRPELLEFPGEYTSSRAESINERGVITGRAWNDESEVFIRWRVDTARTIDSPDVDINKHTISHVAGKYFAGYGFDPTAVEPWRTFVPYAGTAESYAPITVPDAEYGTPTGLTRSGYVTGQVFFPDDNQMSTAFIAEPDGQYTLLDNFSYIVDPHDFGHLTAVLAGDDSLFVGTCLAALLEPK